MGSPDSPALRVRRDEGRLATRPRDTSTPALSSAGHTPDSPSQPEHFSWLNKKALTS